MAHDADALAEYSSGTDQHALRQNEALLRQVVESAPNAMVMIDHVGRIGLVNAQAERLFGYSRDEMLNQPIELLVPERFRRAHPGLRGAFFGQPSSRPMGAGRDLFGLKKDGSEFPIEIGLNPIVTDSGTLILSSIVDITSRKRMEQRFRQVVESAPSAMVMINAQGKIEMINAQAERLFGYERQEMLGQSIEILVPQRFRHAHPGLRGSFFRNPVSRPMGVGRDLFGLKKDGSEFPIEIGLNPIETDEGPMVLSAIVDITSRKRLEDRFRQVVESAPNAMVMINSSGNIEMINAQAERLFGYPREELLGESIEKLVPDRFRRAHPGLRGSFFLKPVSRPMGAGRDLFGLKRDGSEFPIEIGLNPIETDEGPMVLSAIVDISSRKRLEERFRQVVESAPNAMVMINQTGNIEMVNAQAERVFGYERKELLGQPIELLVPKRFRSAHPELRGSFFTRPVSRPMGAGRDLFGLKKDGSEFPIEIGLNPIETDEGPMVLSAIVDISSRKRLEERFRQVVESAPNAMVMISSSGRIEMVNAQAERVFGYERKEMLGAPIEILVPARFRRAHPELRGSFFGDPVSRPMGVGRDLYGLKKDGTEFPIEIGLNPIETDEGPMVLSAIVDISSRKRLEERFRQVVESAPNAMVMINHVGNIEMVNAQAEGVFGYHRKEMLGKPIEILVPERFRRAHPGLRGSFFGSPVSRPMGVGRDLYGLKKDGTEFPIEIGLNPIETDEGTMVLSAIVDISDRKHKEESIHAALKEKDVLLGEIHHRVKNNLQIVHSLLGLQSSTIGDQIVLGMMRESQNRIRSMALIHQTLYESKDFARVDFRNFLDSLVPNLVSSYGVGLERIKLSMNSITVLLPINAAIPCGLVVNELISNALKHAFPEDREGEIQIDLAQESLTTVRLCVSDTGIGIPEGLDVQRTTTLGLQLVTMLADQLGGELSIQRSNPTRFTLRFPIDKEEVAA
ncbi:MAG TPA: PAS domain S-box protein [Steroidobacteraceae bacterium]